MTSKTSFARIAITLPPETLRSADELAATMDRSRSWVIAEAIRHFAAAQGVGGSTPAVAARLGKSRLEQLHRDAALTAEARVLESEEVVTVGRPTHLAEAPRRFSSYDEFLDWRRQRDAR